MKKNKYLTVLIFLAILITGCTQNKDISHSQEVDMSNLDLESIKVNMAGVREEDLSYIQMVINANSNNILVPQSHIEEESKMLSEIPMIDTSNEDYDNLAITMPESFDGLSISSQVEENNIIYFGIPITEFEFSTNSIYNFYFEIEVYAKNEDLEVLEENTGNEENEEEKDALEEEISEDIQTGDQEFSFGKSTYLKTGIIGRPPRNITGNTITTNFEHGELEKGNANFSTIKTIDYTTDAETDAKNDDKIDIEDDFHKINLEFEMRYISLSEDIPYIIIAFDNIITSPSKLTLGINKLNFDIEETEEKVNEEITPESETNEDEDETTETNEEETTETNEEETT